MEKITLIDFLIPKTKKKILVFLGNFLLILGFAFLTGISAKIKVEIGIVPITMQTLSVLLSGAILGAKRGALSQLTYLIFGLAGIPWFARGGGISYILSPTFGYILGFVFSAFIVGYFFERNFSQNLTKMIFALFLGNLLIYLFGIPWLAHFVGIKKALKVGLYPFILGDALKLLLAVSILSLILKLVKK